MSFELFGFAFVCHINATVKHSSSKPTDNRLFQKTVSEPDIVFTYYFNLFLTFNIIAKCTKTQQKNNLPNFNAHSFRNEYKFQRILSWKISSICSERHIQQPRLGKHQRQRCQESQRILVQVKHLKPGSLSSVTSWVGAGRGVIYVTKIPCFKGCWSEV